MKKFKKLFSLVLIMSTFLMFGCSNSEDTSDSGESEDGVVQLEMATWAGGEELEEMQAIVDAVNEENKDVYNIELISIPDSFYVKIQTQLSAGDAPDLLWMSQEQIIPFIVNGALLPITEYYEASEFSDIAINEELMSTVTYEGEIYGIPWISNPVVLYYNKDIVDDADEAILEATNQGDYMTWDEFHEMAKKYTDIENGKYGMLINGSPAIEIFIWSYGGEIQNEDGTVGLDSPESIAGIQQLADMAVNDPVSPNQDIIGKVGYTETFQQGNTAFLFGGVADNIELISGEPVPFEVGYAVVPNGGTPATFNWSASTVITKDCENPDVAFEAMCDLTEEFWKWKTIPPVQDITQLGYADYTDYLNQNAPQKVNMAPTIEETMKIARVDNYGENTSAIYTAIWEQIYSPILSAAVTGEEVDVNALVDTAMQKIEESQ